MDIEVKQLILMKSYVQMVIIWETGEDAPSTHRLPYTPSVWTSQQKEWHPTLRPIDLLGDKHSQHSPCRPSSQGAQQHSGLDPPLSSSRFRCLKLALRFCSSSALYEFKPLRARSGSSRQVQLNPVPCFLAFPHFFWHSWDLGLLGFQETADPYRKVGVNTESFARA